jgi:hypothetical protein
MRSVLSSFPEFMCHSFTVLGVVFTRRTECTIYFLTLYAHYIKTPRFLGGPEITRDFGMIGTYQLRYDSRNLLTEDEKILTFNYSRGVNVFPSIE